ncbi:hypothetical protein N0V94_003845 [Neodidymelliopsis sp. IMI 364377]|nr:hypothetical protein N0V94_003845 [Neodidymelliopsis sp. IMI 364377]
MSDPTIFWAAKSSNVESLTTIAPVCSRTPKEDEPRKETRVVMKGTFRLYWSQGSTDINAGDSKAVKKVDWADSDDDDDFLASFISDTHADELENPATTGEPGNADLTMELGKENDRIKDLEGTIKVQERRLAEVQRLSDASAAQIKELKDKSYSQLLRIQQMVAEIDEKDRRIAALATEKEERYPTNAGLNAEQSFMQEPPDAVHIPVEEDDLTGTTETEVKSIAQVYNASFNSVQQTAEPITGTKIKQATSITASSTELLPVSSHDDGPKVNLSEFPVFITAATIKHTPPPPPAPKLKMGVDLSKFAKKPSSEQRMPGSRNKSGSKKQPTTTGLAPQIDPLQDIRTKRHDERVLFASGPKIQVNMGSTALTVVSKNVLMQCSNKAFKHFSESPDAASFELPANSMDASAAIAHLDWMKEMTFQGRVYSLTLNSDEKLDEKNLQLCRAARVLGLNNMYIGHFTKFFCDRIRSNSASSEFLSKVATLAYPENDPIYDCLANNLAKLRTSHGLEDTAELQALLEEHSGLKARVHKIEERMRSSRHGFKGAKAVHAGRKTEV